MKRLAVLLLTIIAATSLGACSTAAEPTGTPAYTVTRSWSNGMEEKAVVYADGRTIMTHGEYSEKVTLPADQMAALAAAAGGVECGGVPFGTGFARCFAGGECFGWGGGEACASEAVRGVAESGKHFNSFLLGI